MEMRFTSRARAIVISATAAITLVLGAVASIPAFASIPPGGGGGGDNCVPFNDYVHFSGTHVTFEADVFCTEIGTLYIYGGKGTSFIHETSKTCSTPNADCVKTLTISTSGTGSYCVRSTMDLSSGDVPSLGHICARKTD
jgi:hypothetical protein